MKIVEPRLVLCALAAFALAACASNPPQEPKYPPKCHGPYTPINAPSHYPALAKDTK